MSPSSIITFFNQAENLKNILRHSYTSANRHESVAEHSWMLCLLAVAVIDQVEYQVDLLHLLKMLIVHDLPEAVTGDIPVFDKQAFLEQARQNEVLAMQQLTAPLPKGLQDEFIRLHEEFDAQETDEAKLANALEKAEAFLQHNLADLDTWTEQDYTYQTDLSHPTRKKFEGDAFIEALRDLIDKDTMQKLEEKGKLDKAGKQMLAAYQKGEK